MSVGCIGLAGTGGLVACRLLAAGLAVTVWDADGASVAGLEKEGASVASSPAELARRCEIILVSLPRASGVRELLFGPADVVRGLAAGKVLVDLSATPPDDALGLARQLDEHGVAVLDAAVLSSAAQAAPGDITLVFSGLDGACDRALPVFNAITPNVIRAGARTGDAQTVRLLISTMTIASGLSALEATAAGRKMGLSLRSLTEVFVKGSGRNYTTRFVLPALAQGKTALDVPLSQMLDDMDDAIALAISRGVPAPIAGVARSLLRIAASRLDGNAGFEDVARVIGSLANTALVDSAGESPAVDVAPAKARSAIAIGYVGVGAMGGALARRLMESYTVHVFDAQPGTARALEAEGAIVADDLRSLARDCDVVVLCVPGSKIVREVLFGKGGLAEGLCPGKIVIDQTTGDPVEAIAIAADLRKLGVPMVDAPVSGGPETPQAGTSVMICGGSPDAFGEVLPVLKAIGPNVVYCGPEGSGHAAKLANNASNICNRVIAYEAAMLGCKYGISLDVLHRAVNLSTGWSWASQRMFKAVATHAQTASIRLELSLKDIASAVKMGIGCGAPMLIGDSVRSIVATAVHRFGGDANVDEMARLFEQMAGIDFTVV